MRLVPLQDWIDQTFEGERKPDPRTIREQIKLGEWPAQAAQKVGCRYFIDLDKLEPSNEGDWLLNATA